MNDEIDNLKSRNKKVESDKAWEISITRRLFIAIITYGVAFWFMKNIGVNNSHLNAFIPTGGYILSTLALSPLKKIWMIVVYNKNKLTDQ